MWQVIVRNIYGLEVRREQFGTPEEVGAAVAFWLDSGYAVDIAAEPMPCSASLPAILRDGERQVTL